MLLEKPVGESFDTDIIESTALTTIERFLQEHGTCIVPRLSKNDKFPLFDGCIIVYKSPNLKNDNILDTIDVQLKGKTQSTLSFSESAKFPVDFNFIRMVHGKLGGIFFLVRINSKNYQIVQAYYNILNYGKTSELFGKIKGQKTISISLCKLTLLNDFTDECVDFIKKKHAAIQKITGYHPAILEKRTRQKAPEDKIETWHKTIFFNNQKYFHKHPLNTLYSELKSKYRSIFFIGEPRLGKSFEMEALYANIKKDKPFAIFFDLSQYRGGDLEKDLGLSDANLPYDILLDGYDEISPYLVIFFRKEMERIFEKYLFSTFVISSREYCKNDIPIPKTGFTAEVYLAVSDPYDLINAYDEDTKKILTIESETLRELFMIPIYRPIINEIKNTESIYDTLINHALKQNREKLSSKYGENSVQPNETFISRFICIAMEMYDNRTMFITKDKDDLLFETDFLKSLDDLNYTFSNKTYYDYFIALHYSKLPFDEILKFFFVNNKLRINVIDIFGILFDLVNHNARIVFNELFKKLESESLEALLLSDFSTMTDDDRYKYYIRILEYRNNNKNYIYYSLSRPEYGPLKNIKNMAKKMQELLPESRRKDAFNILFNNVNEYLKSPDAENMIIFANSIILLNQYSENYWNTEQLDTLKNITMQIIVFFSYNENSKIIKNLLSYRIIFLWYRDYGWTDNWNTEEWEIFIAEILDEKKKLDSEIITSDEFSLKLIIFCYFHENERLNSMIKPLLFYSLKQARSVFSGTMDLITDENTDNDTIPIMHFDYELLNFYEILPQLNISLNIVLELLLYVAENGIKDNISGIHNPVTTLENKLYEKIDQLQQEYYSLFSAYFFNKNTLLEIYRFFESTKDKVFDCLKIYLLQNIDTENIVIPFWIIESLLAKLLNLSDKKLAMDQYCIIKNKFYNIEKKTVYTGVIYEINHDTQHILHKQKNIQNEYLNIFAERIDYDKKHNEIKKNTKKKIEKMLAGELQLMLDNKSLENEVSNVINYLYNPENFSEERTFIGKIRSLGSEHILNNLEYLREQKYRPPPIFSKTALFFIEKKISTVNGENLLEKKEILNILRNEQEKPFYIYFYWYYVVQDRGESYKKIMTKINCNLEIKNNILASMQNDIPNKFKQKVIKDFDGSKSIFWVSPFIFFAKHLNTKKIVGTIEKRNILKLIACTMPNTLGLIASYEVNLSWFTNLFSKMISSSEIVKYGLECMQVIKNDLSRLQILNYLIDYYNAKKDVKIMKRIMEYIIEKTQEMFSPTEKHVNSSEYSVLSSFWSKCGENYIDELFPMFSIGIVLSTVEQRPNDINYQYRRDVLEYCIYHSTESQKTRIISEINSDHLYTNENETALVKQFLAYMGDEANILSIIDEYLKDEDQKVYDTFNMNYFGYLQKSDVLLNKYIELLFHSIDFTDKQYSIHRGKIIYLARNGIQQHITVENFAYFENKINSHISKLKSMNKYTDFIEDFLLQIEQYVYSI